MPTSSFTHFVCNRLNLYVYKLDKLGAIDYAKLIFACFIPLLHIRFNNFALDTLIQYVSRMGVLSFFAVSGMMLSLSIQKRGNLNAMPRFLKRTGKLLIIWLIIYIPILWGHYSVREIIFNTPAYL